jgi:hypothetical protein
MRLPHSLARSSQRGAAALIVVVVLFFILAMVTAYAGRNLIFEQRTSVNNQRATQAFEMAEAGLEFAVTLLSGGRVNDVCQPDDTSPTTFRQRHLTLDPSGRFTLTGGQPNLRPTCILPLSGTATCSCPAAGPPDLIEPVGLAPTLQLQFQTVAQPGLVRVVSRGCSSIGEQCYAASDRGKADAVAETSMLLALNSALATPPSAALTARGTVNLNSAAVTVSNADPLTAGITINVGGEIINDGAARIASVPGTPVSTSIRKGDPSFRSRTDPGAPITANQMFAAVFGMDRSTYRSQPAAVRITCSGDCGSAIADAASDNPGRVIWVQGPVTIGSNRTLGGPGIPPVMLVVQGNLTVSADLTLFGVLYLHDPSGATSWATNAGTTTVVHGAVIAEGDLSITGTPTISFDPNVLRTINLSQGSMVRVPGSWRDFAAGS